jgi:hypothetical protein
MQHVPRKTPPVSECPLYKARDCRHGCPTQRDVQADQGIYIAFLVIKERVSLPAKATGTGTCGGSIATLGR